MNLKYFTCLSLFSKGCSRESYLATFSERSRPPQTRKAQEAKLNQRPEHAAHARGLQFPLLYILGTPLTLDIKVLHLEEAVTGEQYLPTASSAWQEYRRLCFEPLWLESDYLVTPQVNPPVESTNQELDFARVVGKFF